MHREPKQFVASVKQQYPEFFTGKKVLEVGSLDINGSVRPFFTNCDYTGIDLGEGPRVDIVARAGNYIRSDTYDVIISTETLEHDQFWPQSLKQMYGNLKQGGLLVITCAAPNRPEHGTTRTGSAEASPFTSDYYRNISVEDFAAYLPADLFEKSYLGYRGDMDDLYFAGIKKGAKRLTVTAEISTFNRYETTLPMCISAILNQTRKPDRLVIYDDGEQKDLRELSPFDGLLRWADDLGISWEFFSTPREGQVTNHQHCLDNCQTDVIFRCDDDLILEPNVLEEVMRVLESDEKIGAAAPLIHHPGSVSPLPPHVDGSLNDVSLGLNVQWFQFNSGPKEVQHLYSSFAMRTQVAREAGGYPRNLSAVGHHEESILSHSIYRAGYKLYVTPFAKAQHLRSPTGGIRSYTDTNLWAHDEEVFQQYLKTWGVAQPLTTLKILDCGRGDHLIFRGVFDQIKKRLNGNKIVVAACYPEALEGLEGIEIISIAEAKLIVGNHYESFSLYAWCWNNQWTKSLPEAMVEFYGQP